MLLFVCKYEYGIVYLLRSENMIPDHLCPLLDLWPFTFSAPVPHEVRRVFREGSAADGAIPDRQGV